MSSEVSNHSDVTEVVTDGLCKNGGAVRVKLLSRFQGLAHHGHRMSRAF